MRAGTFVLLLAVVLLAIVPTDQADGASDLRTSFDSIPQDELDELLGERYLDTISRYVLESVGINATGRGCPIKDISATDIRFGLDMSSGDDRGSGDAKKQMESAYSYYIEYDLLTSFSSATKGYDAFDERITGGAFDFTTFSPEDVGTIRGHVRLNIESDMRETATRQPYDSNVYAIDSSTMTRTTFGLAELSVTFAHGQRTHHADIVAEWDVRSVTVSDFIYPHEGSGIRPGDEFFCRWSSREDSADVSVRLDTDHGVFYYNRDIGDCTSGTSHGTVPDSLFQVSSATEEVGGIADSVSGPLKEFSRGELSGEYMRDDGVEPYAGPRLVEEGPWQPVMSLIAALVFVLIAISLMHEGRFRHRSCPEGSPVCRRSGEGTFPNPSG